VLWAPIKLAKAERAKGDSSCVSVRREVNSGCGKVQSGEASAVKEKKHEESELRGGRSKAQAKSSREQVEG